MIEPTYKFCSFYFKVFGGILLGKALNETGFSIALGIFGVSTFALFIALLFKYQDENQ